jgi:hypothetical protein
MLNGAVIQQPSEEPLVATVAQCPSPASLARRQQEKIAELRQSLIENGYRTVFEQAKALGLCRSSAWAVLQANHKHRGLSPHVIRRILASPELPANARRVIEDYVRQRLAGAYGHPPRSLQRFHAKLDAVGFRICPAAESCVALQATTSELCGTEGEEFAAARFSAQYQQA